MSCGLFGPVKSIHYVGDECLFSLIGAFKDEFQNIFCLLFHGLEVRCPWCGDVTWNDYSMSILKYPIRATPSGSIRKLACQTKCRRFPRAHLRTIQALTLAVKKREGERVKNWRCRKDMETYEMKKNIS